MTELVITTSDSSLTGRGRGKEEDEVRLGRRLHVHPQRLRRQLHRHEAEAYEQGSRAAEPEARFLAKKKKKSKRAGATRRRSRPSRRTRSSETPPGETQPKTLTVLPGWQNDPEDRPGNGEKMRRNPFETKTELAGEEEKELPSRPFFPVSGGTVPRTPAAERSQTSGGVKLIQEPELAPGSWRRR